MTPEPEAVALARNCAKFDTGTGADERTEVKLARAVLALHAETHQLRAGLKEALDGWDENARALVDDPHHQDEARIASLRKLLEGTK